MYESEKLSLERSARNAALKRSATTFLSVLALIVSARAARTLTRTSQTRKQGNEKRKPLLNRSAVQIALFPTLLPKIYSYLKSLSHRFGLSSPGLAELVSSTLFFLIPPSWRVHVALYAASSALYHSAKSSRRRSYLPPTWILNVIGNAVLMLAFVFKSEAFPSAYDKVVLSNSTYYLPRGMLKPEREDILRNTTYPQTSPDSDTRSKHTYELCTRLHPSEPSCLKNFLNALLSESLRSSRWVGAFGALPILLSRTQRRNLVKNPETVLQRWFASTLRGTAFVSGSITTSWAMTCLLQRILPNDRLRHARWLINSFIGSLWILILPAKRRDEISLYVARLATLCAWRAWRLDGGRAIPFGDVALFALSWMQLVRLQGQGERISGIVGMGLSRIQRG